MVRGLVADQVEPASGRTVWTYYIPDFNGWKPGDNRFVFKVGSFFSDTYAFYTKPVVADLDLDGVKDLVYAANNNRVYALNGKTGKALWVLTPNDRTYIQPYVEIVYDKIYQSCLNYRVPRCEPIRGSSC